jgi:hypothetical protein
VPEVFELDIIPVGAIHAVDGASGTGLGEDAIEAGAPPRDWAWQPPNWLDPLLGRIPTRFVLVLLVLGLAIAAGVSAIHPSTTKAAPAPLVLPTPSLSPTRQVLASMVALAESPAPLADFVISDNVHPSCPSAFRTNADLVTQISTTVSRYQPGYQLRDASIGSEITGVCSAQLRFTGELGNTLVLTIIAPPNSLTPFTVTSDNDRTDAIDVVMNVNGWRIEVGMVGQPGTMLDEMELVAVGTDARLRWS